jgi:hypothetical protein
VKAMVGNNIQFIKYISSKKALYRTPTGLKIKKIFQEPISLNKNEDILYKRYKRSAIDRGIEFNLSTDVFKKLIHSNCFYCGLEPKQLVNGMEYNGIDRLENLRGYEFDNCLACCKTCNRAKSNLTENEFMDFMIRICKQLVPQMLAFQEGNYEEVKRLKYEQLRLAGCYNKEE